MVPSLPAAQKNLPGGLKCSLRRTPCSLGEPELYQMVHQGKPFDRLSKGSWGLVFPTGSWSSSYPPVSERPLPLGHNSAGRAELRGGTNPCSSGHSHLRVESNETGSQRVFRCVVDRQENGARRGQDTCPAKVSPGVSPPPPWAQPRHLLAVLVSPLGRILARGQLGLP